MEKKNILSAILWKFMLFKNQWKQESVVKEKDRGNKSNKMCHCNNFPERLKVTFLTTDINERYVRTELVLEERIHRNLQLFSDAKDAT